MKKENNNVNNNDKDVKKERPQNRFLKPIKPGECRNPTGRPKGLSITTLMKEALAQNDNELAQKLAKALPLLAIKGNPAAINAVINRVDGLQTAKVDMTTNGENINNIIQIDLTDPDWTEYQNKKREKANDN